MTRVNAETRFIVEEVYLPKATVHKWNNYQYKEIRLIQSVPDKTSQIGIQKTKRGAIFEESEKNCAVPSLSRDRFGIFRGVFEMSRNKIN